MRTTLKSALALFVIAALSLTGTVAVAAIGEWGVPVTISQVGQDAWGSQVVTDGATITATWLGSDGSHDRVQVSSSPDGGGTWSTPVTLSKVGQDAWGPQLVTDGTTVTATWYRYDGTNGRIQVSSSTDGGAMWGVPVTLSEAGQDAWGQQLATDGTTITAAWNRHDGTHNRVQVSSSTDGGATWGTPITLSEAEQNAWDPQVVTDGTTITATWHRWDGSNWRVQVSSSADAGATWGVPVAISGAGQDAWGSQVVTDGATITATWLGSEGGHDRVQVSSSPDGGATWGAPVTLSKAGQDAWGPQLVTDGTTVTAAWYRYDGTHGRIQVSSSTDGGATWGTPVTLSEAGQDAWGQQLATDGTTVTAAWNRHDGTHNRVQVSSSTDGGATWGTPVTLSEAEQNAWDPQVVTNGATVTATWHRWDGSNWRVQVSSSTHGVATWGPELVADGDTITATWSRVDGDRWRIQVSSKAGVIEFSDVPTTHPFYDEIMWLANSGVTDGTTITATWSRSDANRWRIQASSKSGVIEFSDVSTTHPFYDEIMRLAKSSIADGTTIWYRYDGNRWRIQESSEPGVIEFSDVPTTHPFYDEIMWLEGSGITGGDTVGTFRPSDTVTRQAMLAFLYRAAGSPAHEPPADSPFSDVSAAHPFYTEITWMAALGLRTGDTDGVFRSSDAVTRQAMSEFLYRVAGSPAHTPPAESPFSDVTIDHPFYAEITWMADSGMSTGYIDGTFKPSSTVTRQAMSAFLQRMDALVV